MLNKVKSAFGGKKIISLLSVLVLFFSFATTANAATVSVVSDTSVSIVGVYNKSGGPINFVDLSVTPGSAVIAAEPTTYPTVYFVGASNSVWDSGTGFYFQSTNPGAEWIWDTIYAEDAASLAVPLYDPNASSNGRVVVFEKTFDISGIPQSATMNIAADNCYEVWVNGHFIARSATAPNSGWELTSLYENDCHSSGWQTVGHYSVSASDLLNGTNTIKILAGNEYYSPDDPNFEYSNFPVPPYVASPYRQQNPGALIFKMDVSYEPNPGCTLTQGYWKTHSENGPAHPDENWGSLAGDTFFSSSKTYYGVLWTAPSGGNVYYQLAHQYIAAKLNISSGAITTPAVDAAMTWAGLFFNSHPPSSSLSKADRNLVLSYAGILGNYNEGLIGPGHCLEELSSF